MTISAKSAYEYAWEARRILAEEAAKYAFRGGPWKIGIQVLGPTQVWGEDLTLRLLFAVDSMEEGKLGDPVVIQHCEMITAGTLFHLGVVDARAAARRFIEQAFKKAWLHELEERLFYEGRHVKDPHPELRPNRSPMPGMSATLPEDHARPADPEPTKRDGH